MSGKIKILIIIVVIVVLIWVVIRISSAALLGPRAPRPATTRGEFDFRLVYEIDGERFMIEDTLIIEHAGTGWDAGAGHFNKWNSHFESGNDGIIELFRDESERIFMDIPRYLTPRYLMGERYLSPTRHLIRRVGLNDNTIPSSRLTLLEDENGYTKLYKRGKVETDPSEKAKLPNKPIPHLFLISDEFAELKANEPEFMAELVSVARIGRSLGVHLILATQKPSGVVDDQICSNSRFKLALKVADESDSNEVIKTPDAAAITEPGRAYLQVGNNETYELFQSAWSGPDYDPDKTVEEKVDTRIWLINDLGQYELLTQDDSDIEGEAGIAAIGIKFAPVVAGVAAAAFIGVGVGWLAKQAYRNIPVVRNVVNTVGDGINAIGNAARNVGRVLNPFNWGRS